jgi:MIP family channel proteins
VFEKKQTSSMANWSWSKSFLYYKVFVPFAAEFFGLMLLTFTHNSTVNTITRSTDASTRGNAFMPATNDGLTVSALVWAFANISGGHVNPAVTLAAFIGGACEWWKVPLYLVAQLCGAMCGACFSMVANGYTDGYYLVAADRTAGEAMLMELITTGFLCLVVLIVAVEEKSDMAPLAIGLSIWVGIMGSFNVTGGCLNPGVSFGAVVVSGTWRSSYWIYWVGPLLGGAFAGLFFRTLFSKEKNVFAKYLEDKATGGNTPVTSLTMENIAVKA